MPLCLQNSGKYLGKRFLELRNQAYEDETMLSDAEKAFAETSNMEYKNLNMVGQWEVETLFDPYYDNIGGKLIDVRSVRDPTFVDPEKREKSKILE